MEEFHVENFNDPVEEETEKTTDRFGQSEQNAGEEEENGSALKEILSWVATFVIAIAAALLIKNFLIINADVPPGSMERTIMPGDRFIGNRLAYLKSDPERGDIVVFKYPDDESENYVKRVIGLPGETVVIENGKIYINGSEQP